MPINLCRTVTTSSHTFRLSLGRGFEQDGGFSHCWAAGQSPPVAGWHEHVQGRAEVREVGRFGQESQG